MFLCRSNSHFSRYAPAFLSRGYLLTHSTILIPNLYISVFGSHWDYHGTKNWLKPDINILIYQEITKRYVTGISAMGIAHLTCNNIIY